MLTFFKNLDGLELLFACCALFGTALFIIRIVIMFTGSGSESETGDHGGDFHMDGADGPDGAAGHEFTESHPADSDLSFKLLSLQGITAFFMMFGLVGWAVLRQGSYPPLVPLLSGTLAGLFTVWVMKRIFQAAGRLQSSGTLNLSNAVGQEGTVYLTIRPGQTGKVRISVQERLMVLDAAAADEEELKTGQTVCVTSVRAGKLIVKKRESKSTV